MSELSALYQAAQAFAEDPTNLFSVQDRSQPPGESEIKQVVEELISKVRSSLGEWRYTGRADNSNGDSHIHIKTILDEVAKVDEEAVEQLDTLLQQGQYQEMAAIVEFLMEVMNNNFKESYNHVINHAVMTMFFLNKCNYQEDILEVKCTPKVGQFFSFFVERFFL